MEEQRKIELLYFYSVVALEYYKIGNTKKSLDNAIKVQELLPRKYFTKKEKNPFIVKDQVVHAAHLENLSRNLTIFILPEEREIMRTVCEYIQNSQRQ